MGLEPNAMLARPLDAAGRPIPLEGRGVILSRALAARLGVAPGGGVDLDVLEGRRPKVFLPVTALADDYSGLYVYMARAELNHLTGDGDVASGAQLLAAPDARQQFYAAVESRPQIVGAASRDDTVANWRATLARSFSTSVLFYLAFSGAIAVGVSYNMGRITLAERARDLATLQVLGFSRADCAYILYGEIAFLALVATPLGWGLGVVFSHALAAAFAQDEIRLPVTVTPRTMALSFIAYLAAVVAGCLMLQRQLSRLDLVAVLKTRE
jgi:putative ABC transport system permease protein